MKDHKVDFKNNQKTKLINRCYSDIGKISKIIMIRLNYTSQNQPQSGFLGYWNKNENKNYKISFKIIQREKNLNQEQCHADYA